MADYVSVWFPTSLTSSHYETHWMIADQECTIILEAIDNELVIASYDQDGIEIMTNFYRHGVTLNDDMTVTINRDGSGTNTAGVTAHGAGLERYNLAVNYLETNKNNFVYKTNMTELMRNLKYTNTYDIDMTDFWYTEFVGAGNTDVTSTISTYESVIGPYIDQFDYRSRDPYNPGYGTWQTVHSCLYDMSSKSVYIIGCQEEQLGLCYRLGKMSNSVNTDDSIYGNYYNLSLDLHLASCDDTNMEIYTYGEISYDYVANTNTCVGIYDIHDSESNLFIFTGIENDTCIFKSQNAYVDYYITLDKYDTWSREDSYYIYHETWTFTMDDDTSITKEVCLWTGQA